MPRAIILFACILLSSTTALAQSLTDPLRLPTGFHLTFNIDISDIRSDETRRVQGSALQYNNTANNHQTTGEELSAVSNALPPITYTLVITASPGGMAYHLYNKDSDFLWVYDETRDETYNWDKKTNSFLVLNGLDTTRLSYMPMPGVGLYKFVLFDASSTLGSETSTDQTGLSYLLNGASVPAVATLVRWDGGLRCERCQAFFPSTNHPSHDWEFSNFLAFGGKWLARDSICTTYYGYNPPYHAAASPSIFAPWTLTKYVLVSASPADNLTTYDIKSLMKSADSHTMVEFFHNHVGSASFTYNPSGGSIDVQEQRAQALATAMNGSSSGVSSATSGLVLLAVIVGITAWRLFASYRKKDRQV